MKWLIKLASPRSHSRPASRGAYKPPKVVSQNQDVSTQKNRQNIKTKVHFEDSAELEWRGRRRSGALMARARLLRPNNAFVVTVSRRVDNTGSSSRIAKLRVEMGVNPVQEHLISYK